MSRRGLLLGGAAAVAVAVLPRSGSEEKTALGYALGTAGYEGKKRGITELQATIREVVPAVQAATRGLLTKTQAKTARIVGLSGAVETVRSVDLDVLYPSADGGQPAAFNAWRYSGSSRSQGVQFALPKRQAEFVATITDADGTVRSLRTKLGAASRPGVYLFSLEEGRWSRRRSVDLAREGSLSLLVELQA